MAERTIIRYKVPLTQPERDELKQIIKKASHSTRTFRKAYILLNCDEGDYSDKITNAEIVGVLKEGCALLTGEKEDL